MEPSIALILLVGKRPRLAGRSLCALQDARHAFVADLEAFRLHRLADGPQRVALGPQLRHLANSLLLVLMLDKLTAFAAPVAERHDAAEITPAGLLVGLHLSDALADAVALSFCECRGDGQE